MDPDVELRPAHPQDLRGLRDFKSERKRGDRLRDFGLETCVHGSILGGEVSAHDQTYERVGSRKVCDEFEPILHVVLERNRTPR